MFCVQVPHGILSRVAKQKHRKGQAGVGSQFSLGHRWHGEQNVKLSLGVMWRRGLRNVCAYMCVCACVCMLEVGGELFVNTAVCAVQVQESECERGSTGRGEMRRVKRKEAVWRRRGGRERGVAEKGGENIRWGGGCTVLVTQLCLQFNR